MKNITTYILISFSFAVMLLGCYSEKRAARQLVKAQTQYPHRVAKHCSRTFPPLAYEKDSFIYLPGDPVVFTDTIINTDTITRMQWRYINKYHYKTDTVYISRQMQVVNKAAEIALSHGNAMLSSQLAAKKAEHHILLWVSLVLGGYTLLRWVLLFWRIRLP